MNDPCFKAPRDHAVAIDVPAAGFLCIEGQGSPYDPGFQGAIRAIYSVAYAVHFDVKKRTGENEPVLPLEALWWWSDGKEPSKDARAWRWRLMIRQSDRVKAADVARAIRDVKAKHPEIAADLVKLRRYHEGKSYQIMHVGPYKDEAATIARLHEDVKAAGLKPSGMHHEIYLGDPRRSAPEKLRTLLRQPVKPLRSAARAA